MDGFNISNIIIQKVSRLKPYPGNAKIHSPHQIEKLADSIREFGFVNPVLIDKNLEIVAGHGRVEAAKQIGLSEIPCIFVEGLSEVQIRAYRLADNKLSELGEWDPKRIEKELEFLKDFKVDIDLTGFDFDIPLKPAEGPQSGKTAPDDEIPGEDGFEPETGYYGDAREATFNAVNLHDFDPNRTAGIWQLPTLRAEKHVPEDLISFNYVLSTDAFDKGVHFYIDDYQFERLWNRPHDYIERLSKFDCCLTPDFSLYTEMPLAMQLWNVYRSRLLGQIWQDAGIKVIPTLQWCREDSFQFCFDGIEPGGVVSVSTIGVKRDPQATKLWYAGMDEAIKRLHPRFVIVYGGDIGYRFDCGVKYIENHNSERFKNGR